MIKFPEIKTYKTLRGKFAENTDFDVDDVIDLLKKDLLLTIKHCLMYEHNVQSTWDCAKQAVEFELSRYANFIEKYDIIINGTQYNDKIAQQSSSLEEYKLKYMAIYGMEPRNMSTTEFAVRHYVTKPDEVYFSVDIAFVGGKIVNIGTVVS